MYFVTDNFYHFTYNTNTLFVFTLSVCFQPWTIYPLLILETVKRPAFFRIINMYLENLDNFPCSIWL